MLSNPAYTTLIVHLDLARRHMETVQSISRELFRDGMLTGECRNAQATLNDITYMELLVRQRASGALADPVKPKG